MKRPYRLKYVLTFLTSIAVTFHFLQSRSPQPNDQRSKPESDIGEAIFGESNALRRRLPQGLRDDGAKPGFQVLLGNVTVHVGEEKNDEKTSYVTNPENLCNSFEDDSQVKLLIFVASTAENSDRRQAIRDTWGLRALQVALNFRVLFVLGRSDEANRETIATESFRYGDILQTEVIDSFRNLGRKTLVGLTWSKDYCPNANFVMKTDDDILIHVPNVIRALKTAKDTEKLLLCHENRMRKILRKELLAEVPENYSKYEVPEKDLPGIYYPPYCSGMAYVFSHQVRDRLLWASSLTPVFFIEDVYLTGFCRYKAGVLIRPHAGITLRPPVTKAQAACSFKDGRITSHEVGVEELRELWAEINTQGFFCPEFVGYARSGAQRPIANEVERRYGE